MAADLVLSRDDFREAVFDRDGHRCVNCGVTADEAPLDAHHIIERRLFDNGGYLLDNGVTLCDRRGDNEGCHMLAEQTVLSCQQLRSAAGITRIVVPDHLVGEGELTKWGDTILADGRRSPGELFDEPSVQKVLAAGGVLDLYVSYLKYPRTPHLPWSPGRDDDDIEFPDTSHFEGRQVIVTEKLDGESTTMYRDHIHARSIDSTAHASRTWVRRLQAQIRYDIPERWRVCGENLQARHSVAYDGLPSYLFIYSIWDQDNRCLSWQDTREWAALLDLPTVPVIYEGLWDEEAVRASWNGIGTYSDDSEGYVVRVADSFTYADFRRCVAKYVRKGHVDPDETHWFSRPVVPNGLS